MIFAQKTLHDSISRGIDSGFFDDGMKLADLTPIHKKMLQLIEILVVLQQNLKFLNKIMHKQMSEFLKQFLSPFMCGYRKDIAHTMLFWFYLKNGVLF